MTNIITSDGTTLHITKSGQGIPCIFLHGGPGYWSYSFEKSAGPSLENFMQMYYLDQRGCGRSSLSKQDDYSLKRLLQDLEEIRNEFGLKKWLVMGHSFGGILATNYAKRYPESTLGLILLNCTLNKKETNMHQMNIGKKWLNQEKITDNYESMERFYEDFFGLAKELLERELYYDMQFESKENLKVLEQLDKDLIYRSNFREYAFKDIEFFQDYTKITSQIHTPTLIISGKHDHAIGPDHYKKFKFPNKYVTILDDRHHPYIENPKEFQHAIQQFVERGFSINTL
ncbi:alpha/beta fold hydrolase [Bacillus gaemokensis]|uniref:alpha/beta fold hydrolase n=1 Tax=Bacillus gaemokensis TaxID=574375 RepID=UPI000534DCCC|nr:alpha/beta fold hydrolase [Bacillus gaemokensis]KYG32995.1 hypothetical protein AZF08_27305 [Bacillus gaemokensis]